MRILHTPIEIAEQASFSVAGLQALGVTAHLAIEPHPFAYKYTPEILLPSINSVQSIRQRVELSLQLSSQYDVFHYHWAQSMLPEMFEYVDAYINSVIGKKCIIEFWGSDVRIPEIESQRNPFFSITKGEDNERARKRLKLWSEITKGHVIVASKWYQSIVEPYFPNIHYVRQRINLDNYTPLFPSKSLNVPRIVHIPSHTGFKGSNIIKKVINDLKIEGVKFDYVEISRVSHKEAMNILSSADLLIDQVKSAEHGVLTLEAMALGKPVMVSIADWMLDWYPTELPIINVNPLSLYSLLKDWLKRKDEWYYKGVESRKYVEKYHSHIDIAKKLIEIYKKLP